MRNCASKAGNKEYIQEHIKKYIKKYIKEPHEKLLGISRVSNPATRKDLADRTWGGSGTNSKCRFCSR